MVYVIVLTEDLVTHQVSVKFVPGLLTEDERIQHISL